MVCAISNSRVCEGCGDCSVQSSCIAIQPLPTDFGVKRRIDQSACNKDFSCLQGFCPSFIELEGAELRKPDRAQIMAIEADRLVHLPDPELPAPWRPDEHLRRGDRRSGGSDHRFPAGIGGLFRRAFLERARLNRAVAEERVGGQPGSDRRPRAADPRRAHRRRGGGPAARLPQHRRQPKVDPANQTGSQVLCVGT